jgi:peptidoglycan/LPS O-acetylase OafA/YrhL
LTLAAPAGSAARAGFAPGASRAIPSPFDWQHLPALDGLRAAAVGAVLLFHAGHLQGGFLGVDLFFALSGFLITSLLLRDAEHGGVRLLAFWGRRFRRLLPAAFVLIAIVALGAWVLGSPAELDGVRRTGGWALGYMANWHFITEADGYWVSFDRPSMFDHLWSLAIEEQFYVVWPLVVVAVWKLSRARYRQRNLLAVCVGGVAASFVAMLVLQQPGSDPTRVYMGTDTRAASILVGAALATAPARRIAMSAIVALGRRADRVIALLAVGIGASWVVVDGANSAALYRGGLLLHSAAAAALVTALASAPGGRVGAALSWRPLVWVGVRSYGLYLWHWPVYVMLSSERTGLEGPTLTVVRIAVSSVLAAASFRLVEDPIRHRATWVRDRRGLPALAGAVALVAATLIVLPQPRSEIAAFDPGSITAPRTASPVAQPPPVASPAVRATPSTSTISPSTTSPSTTSSTSPTSTTISSTGTISTSTITPATIPTATISTSTITPAAAPPPPADAVTAVARTTIRNVMWTGDSIAYDLAPAVGAALTGAGVLADSSAYLGMRLIGDGQFALLPRLREALPVTQVDVLVVQLSIWDADHDAATQRAALDDLHALVVDHGGRLVLISPPPTVDTAKDGRLSTMTDHARAIAAADPASTAFLDSAAVWGLVFDDDLDDDGTPERKRDGVHVCPSGAARFALWLTSELALRFGGVAPTPPTEWAIGTWVTDARYDEPIGSCAPLS